jgi:hypothetical protein
MVLKSKLKYEPPFNKIEKESDIIILLDDVAVNLCSVGYPTPMVSLKEFLPVIEKGKYEVQGKDKYNIVSVDLSKAQDLIQEYRRLSEGGCYSCINIGAHHPFPNETSWYCKLSETGKTSDEAHSPRVEKFYKTGCDEIKHILPKTIEEVLKDFK